MNVRYYTTKSTPSALNYIIPQQVPSASESPNLPHSTTQTRDGQLPVSGVEERVEVHGV